MNIRAIIDNIIGFCEMFHLTDLAGIVASFVMALISLVPLIVNFELYQLAVVVFFVIIFALRLVLFIWDTRVTFTPIEAHEEAKMMLVTSIVMALMHSTCLIATVYQLILQDEIPFVARYKMLAIVYGAFAFGKIILSMIGMIRRKKSDLYFQTLSYIGWLSAIYTMTLFTNYILIANGALDYNWPKYIMIAVLGLTTISLSFVMLVKSVRALRAERG